MSNFYRITKNPVTGQMENAEWLDDYFGRHRYGVCFPDGTVYRQSEHTWEFEDENPALTEQPNTETQPG